MSEHCAERIREDCEDAKAFIEKLEAFARHGFWRLEGERNSAVRHEVRDTYRVWWKRGSLFRMVGFYEAANKRDFIALDSFQKPGDDYSNKQWLRMNEISDIKRDGQWKRKG